MSGLKTCPQCGSEYELDVKFCPKDGSTLRVPAGGNLVGSIIADRYHVLRKLGEGGMGQVYLAEHVKMGRKSAIKVMNPSMSQDPDAIGRFNREAANASRISHNNVCAIYDFGETPDGLIYLAMEYVEGEPLTRILEREGALAPERVANIARQVADALDAAHDMGIVHRDLKPDNIMVAKHRDGSDLVKVVDFGIAKAGSGEGQKVTKTGLVVGTPEYMSPEQLSGDQLDGRSDIYTLGLVTFNMLTGTLPFPSTTIQESMIMRLTDRPRTLTEMRPDVTWPAPLQAVLDRALQRKADDRYQRAGDFGSDMVRAVRGSSTMPAAAPGATAAMAALAAAGAGSTAGTVPPTRVRGGTGATTAPGVAMPATATSPAPAAPSKSRGGLVIAGLGLGAIVIAVTAWLYLGRQHVIPPVAADTAKAKVVASADSTAAAKPGDSTQSTTTQAPPATQPPAPTAPDTTTAAKPDATTPISRKAERHVQRFERPTTQRSAPATTPAQPPPAQTANASAPASVPATTTAAPAAPPPDSEFEGTLTGERARNAVAMAADMIRNHQSDRALRVLGRALRFLPTANDSVTALYHVSEALLERAESTNSPIPRQRACTILGSLRNARGSTYIESINYMYGQYCK